MMSIIFWNVSGDKNTIFYSTLDMNLFSCVEIEVD